jgi:hypothetical protein
MPFVNFRKKFHFFSFDFRQNFDVRTLPRWLSIRGTKIFLRDIQNFFFKILTLVLSDRFLDGFFKFFIFYKQNLHLIRDFWVIFENYRMRMLSIRGNDFIACWAYAEPISSNAEHTRNKFPRVRSQRWNVNIFTCTIYAEHTRNESYRTLSIRGTNFIACWAYWEPISSHAEHARKCLKVEYLSQIEYDFQKSCVRGPRDHKDWVSAKKVLKKIHACIPFTLPLPNLIWAWVWEIYHLHLSPFLVSFYIILPSEGKFYPLAGSLQNRFCRQRDRVFMNSADIESTVSATKTDFERQGESFVPVLSDNHHHAYLLTQINRLTKSSLIC